MKVCDLTNVERRVWKSWQATWLGDKPPPAEIRDIVRQVAYHEAGHVAARHFTGKNVSNTVRVSIIPDQNSDGHMASERYTGVPMIRCLPPPLQRTEGRCMLLELLAGRGAEARIAPPDEGFEILFEDADDGEGEEETSDLFRVWQIADILSRRYMPIGRVLGLAEQWTVEMLALPPVWEAVERLAGLLLERGTIDDMDELFTVCDRIEYSNFKSRKWRRRLELTRAEARQFYVLRD